MKGKRNLNKFVYPSIGLCLLGMGNLHAEGGRNHFLSDGPASVGGTLGGAMVAYPEDAAAVYWNPAGLVGQNSSVFIDHAKTNDEATSSWLGFSGGNPYLKFGLNWKHEGLPLDSHKDAILIGIGIDQYLIPYIPRVPGLSFGTTLGRVSETIYGDSASTYFADLGALYRREHGLWHMAFGGTIKNLYFGGLKFDEGTEEEVWPTELQGGVAVSRAGVTALYTASSVDSQLNSAFGLEYALGKILRLRAGYDDDIRYGIGVVHKDLALSFGYKTGDIQNVPSASISYTWGSKKDVDYTNPLEELEARHKNLEDYLLAEVRGSIQSAKKVDLHKVLQLLAVAPQSDDAWVLLRSMTGEERFKASIPGSKRVRRDYLNFAVPFANGDASATENGLAFLKKHPRAKVSKIIRLIQKHTPAAQVPSQLPSSKEKKK
jgi:hypothetical protein